MSELTAAQWLHVRDQLATCYGLYLDDSRQAQGLRMLNQRLHDLHLGAAAYLRLLQTPAGASELHVLAEQLANHETQFFRNPTHFRILKDVVLREAQQRRGLLNPIRCWSAGCASGEEAYSIALTVLDAFGDPPSQPVQIWGTDLSRDALRRAQDGVYGGRSLMQLKPHQRRWFEPTEDGLRVGAAARSLVQFEQHNLLEPLPAWATEIDVIFCQNVTIYFQLATCRELMQRLYGAMAVGGYLFLGFSETLWRIFDGFETVSHDGAFIYRKGSAAAHPLVPLAPSVPTSVSAVPAASAQRLTPIRPVLRERGASGTQPLHRSADQVLQEARHKREAGEQQTALTLISQIAPGERSPSTLALAAQLHADLGQWDQAAAEARRAIELDVLQDTAYVVLGMLELRHGAWAAAVQYLEPALYLVPESPLVSFYLAESYRQLGRTSAALREYRNTMRKLHDVAPTTLINGVAAAWLHASCGRWLNTLETEV